MAHGITVKKFLKLSHSEHCKSISELQLMSDYFSIILLAHPGDSKIKQTFLSVCLST